MLCQLHLNKAGRKSEDVKYNEHMGKTALQYIADGVKNLYGQFGKQFASTG